MANLQGLGCDPPQVPSLRNWDPYSAAMKSASRGIRAPGNSQPELPLKVHPHAHICPPSFL